MHSILQDLRYGTRVLLKSPRFSVVALITLALGIAANIAIFSFVDAALIRPLPYRDASRLVGIYEARQQTVESQFEASYPDLLDWRKQNRVFDSLAGYAANAAALNSKGESELLPAGYITDNFFQTLGLKPFLGRDFHAGEDQAAASPVVIVGYSWWQKHFSGDPNAIGKTLTLDGKAYTVIGVMPADFHFAPAGEPAVWIPVRPEGDMLTRRSLHWIFPIARLKDGVSREGAAAAMNVIAEQLEQQYPETNAKLRATVVPLSEIVVGQVRPILLVLLAAVGLLLLIACANVANLLLARALSRRREMAVRTALGATRFRLIRQTLVEGLILSFVGGGLGLAGAEWLTKALVVAIPGSMLDSMPYLKSMAIDATIAGFAFLLAVVTGVLFALAPALQLSGKTLEDALKEGARGTTSASWRRFASGLVVSEVAIAMVLMMGAGLLVKSLHRLLSVDAGFNQANLLTMAVVVPDALYEKGAQQIAFQRSVLERVGALPGVQSVGLSSALPLRGGTTANIRVVGQPYTGQGNEANVRTVSPGYFETLQAQLIQGRWFSEEDNDSAPRRAIVNKSFADLYLAHLDPLVEQVLFTCCPKQKPRRIIGVVRDVKEGQLDSKSAPAIYETFLQSPNTYFNLAVRTLSSPDALMEPVKTTIRSIEPEVVIFDAQTMEQRIQQSPAAFLHRYPAWLSGAFAFLGLLLGSIGLYGLVAYSVSQRTQEIGIRMALGAQRKNVLTMVLTQGARLIAYGLALGTAVGIAAASLLRSLLFGVFAADPAVFSVVAGTLVAVTLAASLIPAWLATKVDPMVALRHE
jgi:macrolide transport system ATP-binding/permease protein